MVRQILLPAVLLTTACAGHAQSGTCAAPPDASLTTGGRLTIYADPSEIRIVGTSDQGLRLSCKLKDPSRQKDVSLSISGTDMDRKLRVRGPANSNVTVQVSVPKQTNLRAEVLIGRLTVQDVTGDKELDVTIGEVDVRPMQPGDYRRIEASSHLGDVTIPGMNVEKGGFFRSFARTDTNAGNYILRADVGIGSVQLR